jgi:hypothetical protein
MFSQFSLTISHDVQTAPGMWMQSSIQPPSQQLAKIAIYVNACGKKSLVLTG